MDSGPVSTAFLPLAVVAVFLTGLMVGRTPEYLGKKIGPPENKMIMLYALAAPIAILVLTAVAVLTKTGLAGLTTQHWVARLHRDPVRLYTLCSSTTAKASRD